MLAASLLIVAVRLLFPSVDAETGSGGLFVLAAWGMGFLAALHMFLREGSRATMPTFIFLVAASTAVAAYKHPPLLMFAEWIGVLCIWATVRRSSSPSMMTIPALMILILAVGQSLLSWRQVTIVIPELLSQYKRGDAGMMRDLVQVGVQPGFMFQARLEAGLPWGTFGHTNTLAGFLLLGAPFLAVLWMSGWATKSWVARIIGAAPSVCVLYALALSKCRSAWIGVAAAFAFQALASPEAREGLRRHRRWTLAGGVILAMLFAWKGGNSLESLKYRLEYWRGTMPIIAERPFLGAGWGVFRDHYLPHKLADSSEEIADPHNFLLEIAAAAGIPAALAYFWWLAASVIGLSRLRKEDAEPASSRKLGPWLTASGVLLLATGIVLTLSLASSWTEIGGWELLIAMIAVLMLVRTSSAPTIRSWRIATAAALFGLHIHLLAAGGVGHPSVMLAVWTLAAAATPFVLAAGWKRWLDLGLLGGMLAVGVAFGSMGTVRSVVQRDPLLARLRNVNAPSDDAAARLYEDLTRLTPGDADLWAEISRDRRRRTTDADGGRYAASEAALDRAIELQPLRSGFWHERAAAKLEAASRGWFALEAAKSARDDIRRAVERYPNSPTRQADEAVVIAAVSAEPLTATGLRQSLDAWRTIRSSGSTEDLGIRLGRSAGETLSPDDVDRTLAAAARALELDAATPHFDKKLLPAQRGWLIGMRDAASGRRGTKE
jgi:tetratricopeptide (TPR) repeat protein